ncbi:hypothetical protein GCM10011391_16770 [Pullulanibacillus camelliae]|uniref:Uncharacterized protein n=1 Tax=Pullulanibacillus camelliae TaxID=1707096 RepID=A0A8J2VS24_9BACL|nr:DUF5359 family protein [Pullulanibacillus camelliae]GGE38600.1 hypothetical protein GCM10011391_16770 [Pullulanibacillus camelliae]
MKETTAKSVEKWILRLVFVQLLALIIAQVMMSHLTVSPYLNKAVRYEGVYKTKQSKATDTIQQTPYMWYDEKDKQEE